MTQLDLTFGTWRKSSRSGSNGGACVELALAWRKSARSGTNGGQCVEVADTACHVGVRDSKRPAQPALAVARPNWSAFATATRTGHFDLG